MSLTFFSWSAKKTSGLRFAPEDGVTFGRIFALALYAYEKDVPATIKAIKEEIKESESNKPKLILPSATKNNSKQIEG